jgi:8-oxo-dGTP pyrophosphatase MutT (NUDIX family)
MKPTTCGVLLFATTGELLLGHSTGSPRWDIPKGLADPGEAFVDAAVRELQEEFGLVLEASRLHEVGRFDYLPAKDLSVHAALIERIDPAVCRCTSYYPDRRGRQVPEIDDFVWAPFADISARCGKAMTRVLTQEIDLAALLSSLGAAGPVSVAVSSPAV